MVRLHAWVTKSGETYAVDEPLILGTAVMCRHLKVVLSVNTHCATLYGRVACLVITVTRTR
jgi:hypothetical protein